jgi:predicted acyl esterase
MWTWISRRSLLKAAAWAAVPPGFFAGLPFPGGEVRADGVDYLPVTLEDVPLPRSISFNVSIPGKDPVTLHGHYWYSAKAIAAGTRCPAIIELNPYRCRDGTMYVDSKMHPWFAYNGYLAFRVDLQGSGNSTGSLTDEYTEEELAYCVQIINQVAALPICDGNVGMIGESWSAINSLMVAARDDCPSALKAVVVNCGSDDRYNDDVHYMGGAMMMDNVGWASSMWGWLPSPPDPAVVGDGWRDIWRQRIRNMSFWFEQWAGHQTRDDYWSRNSVRDHYDKVKVPVFIMSGWEDGYKNPVDFVLRGLGGLGKPVAAMLGPYGHRYPFDGAPGPRVDWLRYVVDNWWDRWLKGKPTDPSKQWPELTLWLGNSREPGTSPNFDDSGRWVAEDHEWMKRTREAIFFLTQDGTLSPTAPAEGSSITAPRALAVAGTPLDMGTSMLETSSFGNASNDDLPGDQTVDDARSLTFDSAPLEEDLTCFGYPVVKLNLSCDQPGRGDRGAPDRGESRDREIPSRQLQLPQPRLPRRRPGEAPAGAARRVCRRGGSQHLWPCLQARLEDQAGRVTLPVPHHVAGPGDTEREASRGSGRRAAGGDARASGPRSPAGRQRALFPTSAAHRLRQPGNLCADAQDDSRRLERAPGRARHGRWCTRNAGAQDLRQRPQHLRRRTRQSSRRCEGLGEFPYPRRAATLRDWLHPLRDDAAARRLDRAGGDRHPRLERETFLRRQRGLQI